MSLGSRVAVYLSVLVLTGCASPTIVDGIELPPFPPVDRLACCWLSEESVTFNADSMQRTMHTVVEMNDNKLTVVVLDPMGRRQLALRYDRKGLNELTTPPGWDSRYSAWLVMSIFLHRLEPGRWLQNSPEWQVEFERSVKQLSRGDSTIISLEYRNPLGNHFRTVRIAGSDVRIDVRTLKRREL